MGSRKKAEKRPVSRRRDEARQSALQPPKEASRPKEDKTRSQLDQNTRRKQGEKKSKRHPKQSHKENSEQS